MKLRSSALIVLAAALVIGGCAGLSEVRLAPPDGHTLVREQLVIHSDFPLATQHRLLEDLTARRFDLSRRLALAVCDEPIHVYLFEDADRFHMFIERHHPEFPRRRAFFVETDTRLVVYAHWGDRVAEDLRHEVTHGYLHSMVPNLPLWLDEGLAEYFEIPRGQGGMNRAHLDRLLARAKQGQWQPDLRRLEQFDSAFDMTQDDYAEAWAWAHFLLHSGGGLLRDHLGELRREGSVAPLSLRVGQMFPRPETALADHVRQLGVSGRR